MLTWALSRVLVEMVKKGHEDVAVFVTAFFCLCITGPVDLAMIAMILEAFK